MLDFYVEQSKITSPGQYKILFDQLPEDMNELMRIVQGLLVHRVDGHLLGNEINAERLHELELRTVSNMIEKIISLDDKPLQVPRPPEKRLVSSCRNFAVLYCAFLRHKGIPARVRTGFAHYLFGGTQDHLLTEFWHTKNQRWQLADSRLIPEYVIKAKVPNDLDALNVTKPHFYLAGDIWLSCRHEGDDPNKYGYGLIRSIRGMRHIQDKVIQDLASLNKVELLPWDCWGYMIWDLPNVAPHDAKHIALIDEVSQETSQQNLNFNKITQLYQHPMLQVTEKIISASTVEGNREVSIKEVIA